MTQVKRTITEIIPLAEARKLIGAEVQGVSNAYGVREERDATDRGIVRDVSTDMSGDLRFRLAGGEPIWVTGHRTDRVTWFLEVLQEAPSATTRLDRLHAERARIDEEIAAAEKARKSEGLPEGFRWTEDKGHAAVKGVARGCSSVFTTGWASHPHDWLWIRRDFLGEQVTAHIPFDVMTAIVDRVRAEGGLT